MLIKTYIPDKQTSSYISKLKSKERFVVIKKLKEQPPEGYKFQYIDTQYNKAVFLNLGLKSQNCIPLQYPIGQVIGIKETWGIGIKYFDNMNGKFIQRYAYKSDCSGIPTIGNKRPLPQCVVDDFKWHSPSTIPQEAIRIYATVIRNSVKRVQSLTEDEIYKAGILLGERTVFSKELFANWFNSRFAKPRYRKKTDSYECWAWDNNITFETDIGSDGETLPTYRGKNIEVHCNPYVEIVECEVK